MSRLTLNQLNGFRLLGINCDPRLDGYWGSTAEIEKLMKCAALHGNVSLVQLS